MIIETTVKVELDEDRIGFGLAKEDNETQAKFFNRFFFMLDSLPPYKRDSQLLDIADKLAPVSKECIKMLAAFAEQLK